MKKSKVSVFIWGTPYKKSFCQNKDNIMFLHWTNQVSAGCKQMNAVVFKKTFV